VLQTSDFDYPLPAALIAQEPLADRAASRLLVLERASGRLSHHHFPDLLELIAPEDVLVVNVSRVIPARLLGTREGGQPAELLLVREVQDGSWLALAHPGGKLKPGRRVRFGLDSVAEIEEVLGGGWRRVRFVGELGARATLAQYGAVPLPPYIRRAPTPADTERYQTVYAKDDGSVAAPTAGLHFTPALLDAIRRKGTAVAELHLHVGPGTFKPVEDDDLTRHQMHAEAYAVSDSAVETINARRAAGGKVWAVGTTTVRTLETVTDDAGRLHARAGDTAVFIHPPYHFKGVDRLVTNFHLPRSTLLMLVCAFGGYEQVMAGYAAAVRANYRFYSYGDAMAVV